MGIDPLHPKVTVLGNVNPQILIKRLSKVGKHAELCRYEEFGAEKKEAGIAALKRERKRENNGRREEKQVDSGNLKIEKTKEIKGGGSGGKNQDARRENKDSNIFSLPQDMKEENPLMPRPKADFNVQPQVDFKILPHQYCYIAEPYAVKVPYYAIPPYPAPPVEGFQPPFLRPAERVGDYFSDENTMGCHVM